MVCASSWNSENIIAKVTAVAASALVMGGALSPALASERVTTFEASGLVFKASREKAVLIREKYLLCTWGACCVHPSASRSPDLSPQDSVELVATEDPDVDGVTLYVSDFKRSLADKLAKDFFTEPSQASLTCTATGPLAVKDPRQLSRDGKEIFSESKGLNLFK